MSELVPDTTHTIKGSFRRFYDEHPEIVENWGLRVGRVIPERFKILGYVPNFNPALVLPEEQRA